MNNETVALYMFVAERYCSAKHIENSDSQEGEKTLAGNYYNVM